MTSLQSVADTIAGATGWTAFDVGYRARLLREAGLLPESKRGRGATPIGTKEAATILIGCLVSDIPAKIAKLTPLYANLKYKYVAAHGAQVVTTGTLPEGLRGTFLDALVFFLELCASEEGRKSIGDIVIAVQLKRVSAFFKEPIATIDLRLSADGKPILLFVFYAKSGDGLQLKPGVGFYYLEKGKVPIANPQVTVALGGMILPVLGEVLAQDSEHEPRQKIPDFLRLVA